MASEREYRELLNRAQESLAPTQVFLDALKTAARSHADLPLLQLISVAEERARTLERELDQIWDLFKRPL